MKRKAWLWAFILVTVGLANGPGLDLLWAQTGQTEAERRQQEIDRIKADTELTKERTALEAATTTRLKALIPSFEGKAEVDASAGQLEASMLSTQAVSRVSSLIRDRVNGLPARAGEAPASLQSPRNACGLPTGRQVETTAGGTTAARFVVLAGTEGFDLGVVDFVRGQLIAICTRFLDELPADRVRDLWLTTAQTESRSDLIGGLSVPIQVATALFGALRSDVNITTVATSAITSQLLARGVAESLGDQAILGSEPTIAPSNRAIDSASIEGLVAQLYLIRLRAVQYLARPDMQGDAHKTERERITALITRFDTFVGAITTPDAQGNLMIARAARLESLMAPNAAGVRPHIMRVYVDQSGGSLIRTRNIATFIGVDPLRISGGLVASFTVTNAETGQVLSAGLFACRTGLMRLRRVHDGTWGQARSSGRSPPAPICVPDR
ncbi:MAG TPA: hypothetical protein VGO55_07785 [Allosphingosinicella sp.]|jgi:hypothetical protein|nr:hypothetical protein [Allosphingosinicella sp.]